MNTRSVKNSLFRQFQSRIKAFLSNVKKAELPLLEELKALQSTYGAEAVSAALGNVKLFSFAATPSQPVKAAPAATGKKASGKGKRKRRASSSPKAAASWKTQGDYMSLLRKFPEGRRAHFKRIAKDSGREAAIAAMKEELRSK